MNTYFIQVELRNPSIGKPMLTTNGGFEANPDGCLAAIEQLKKDTMMELTSLAQKTGDSELIEQCSEATFVVLALAKLN